MDVKQLGQKIKDARNSQGLTRKFVAQKINQSPGALAHWENGHRTIKGNVLLDLMEVLKLNVCDLKD